MRESAPAEGGSGTRPIADNGSLLGRMAVRRGIITPEQLAECVSRQEREEREHPERPLRPLGAILLALGYLTDESLSDLLAAQSETLKAPHPDCPTLNREDLLFGKALVREGMATAAQVNSALRLQSSLNSQGANLRLGEVLARRGVLTPAQLKQALALQQKTLLSCTGCGRNFNVRHWHPEREVFCPKCSAVLAPPRSDQTIDAHESHISAPVAAPPPVPAPAGPRLGRYRLTEKLGEGGMGIVWKAWDTELKRIVALKEIKGGASGASGDDVARFTREAQAAARMRHPGIVQVHDVGQIGGRHFFTMDFVQGCSIASLLKRGAARPGVRRSLEIVREAAEALHYAHSQGIVHRDVKPANILIETDSTGKPGSGRVLLTDFGLAKDVKSAGGTRLTVSGDVMGTPAYMSPEQAAGRVRAVGPQSDVFSLGSTLYEMLTGHIPFPGNSLVEILEKIATGEPVPPRRHVARLSRDVETLCLKAIEKDPKQRYSSAEEMAKDIGRWLDGEPIHARPISAAELLWRRAIRRRAIVIPSAAAAILAIVFAGWLALDAGRKAERVRTGLTEAARLEKEGKTEPARDAFRLAFDLDPASQEARRGFERTDAALKAAATAREAERARVTDEATAQKEAFALLERGRPALDQAFLCLYDASSEYEDLVRRVETGQRQIEEAVAKSPRLALGHYLLGRAWELRGWDDKAEECWSKALSFSPDLPVAHYEMGKLHLARSILTLLTPAEEDRSARRGVARELADKAVKEFKAAERGGGLEDLIQREVARAALSYVQGNSAEALRLALETLGKTGASRGTEELWWIAGVSSDSPRARLDLFNRALSLRPKFYLALLSRGDLLLSAKDVPGALHDLNAALAIKPRQARGFLLRGRALQAGLEYDRALADFNRAIEVGGEPVEAYDGRGVILYFKNEWDAAIADFNRALALNASFTPAYNHRGLCREQKSDLDGALADYSTALKLSPNYAATLVNRAAVLEQRGNYDGAIADCTEAIRLYPSAAGAYCNRGIARMGKNDFEGAIADFNEALRIDPTYASALRGRAMARAESGDSAGAKTDADAGLKTDPRDAGEFEGRGLMRRVNGDIDGALADFTEAIRLDPSEPKYFANRAYTYLVMKKDYRAAIEDYSAAIKLSPNYAVALCNRGIAHASLGELEAAISDYTSALATRPEYPAALVDRAMAYDALGKHSAARQDLEQALKIAPATWEERPRVEKELERVREAERSAPPGTNSGG